MEMMSRVKRDARHRFQRRGMDRLRAYQNAQYLSSSARGFHCSRIDDDFVSHKLNKWQEDFNSWRDENADEIETIEELVAGAREDYNQMAKLLSGELPQPDARQE